MPTSGPPGARRVTILLVLLPAGVLLVRHLPDVGVLAACPSRTLVTFGDSLTESAETAHPAFNHRRPGP